jgi:hypothetical protein
VAEEDAFMVLNLAEGKLTDDAETEFGEEPEQDVEKGEQI